MYRSNAPYSSNLGTLVYGWGAIALGLVGFAWGDFASVWQPVPDSLPHRTALAKIVALCLFSAGVAMQWPRLARLGVVVLSILYFAAALLWLPRVIGFPRIYGTWAGFAEQFSLVAAGIVAYSLSGSCNTSRTIRMAKVGCFLYGICVISYGLAHFFALSETAGMVPAWLPPGQRFWAAATGIAFLLAAISILSGVLASLASRLLTAMIIVFGALVWAPALFTYPHVHTVWAGNAINLALIGAAWVVADSICQSSEVSESPQNSFA